MWGSRPSFKIHEGTLSFELCKSIYNSGDYNHKNYSGANISWNSPGRSNYWIKYGERINPVTKRQQVAYYLLMYNTELITLFRDGTIHLRNWPSASTRQVLRQFSPLKYIWSYSNCIYQERTRFGYGWRGDNYPFGNRGDGVVIPPDGFIHGLVDRKRRIKLELRAERRELLKEYRRYALPRLLLGEFGDAFSLHKIDSVRQVFGRMMIKADWWGLNLGLDANPFFHAMVENCSHETIERILGTARTSRQWSIPAKSREDAILKSMNLAARLTLDDDKWYEWYDIPYEPVNVRGT